MATQAIRTGPQLVRRPSCLREPPRTCIMAVRVPTYDRGGRGLSRAGSGDRRRSTTVTLTCTTSRARSVLIAVRARKICRRGNVKVYSDNVTITNLQRAVKWTNRRTRFREAKGIPRRYARGESIMDSQACEYSLWHIVPRETKEYGRRIQKADRAASNTRNSRQPGGNIKMPNKLATKGMIGEWFLRRP